jgi:hypothetical protein
VSDPSGGVRERRGHEPAAADAPGALAHEEPRLLEDAEVLRDRGEREVERLRQLGHVRGTDRQAGQHRSPRGIGKRVKGRVEGALSATDRHLPQVLLPAR